MRERSNVYSCVCVCVCTRVSVSWCEFAACIQMSPATSRSCGRGGAASAGFERRRCGAGWCGIAEGLRRARGRRRCCCCCCCCRLHATFIARADGQTRRRPAAGGETLSAGPRHTHGARGPRTGPSRAPSCLLAIFVKAPIRCE